MSSTRVVLVGFMGAGKSTVGPLLARELAWDFVEMDSLVEAALGLTIEEAFRTRGEAFFREQELGDALSLLGRQGVVIATGGGAFAQPLTRDALAADAFVVWLKAPLETLLERISRDPIRPLASDRARIVQLWAERDPSYRLADFVVETAEATPDAVARRVAERIREGLQLREG